MTHWTGLAPADDDEPTLRQRCFATSQRKLTCRQRVEDCLRRIDEHEPKVKAWVTIDSEGALALADRMDAEDRNTLLGSRNLLGTVVGVKDIVDVAGLPTLAGVEPTKPADWRGEQPIDLPARTIALKDAPIVARLREAGAIILGKTVTTPYAWVDPPPTRNPWDHDRTPGGSSSGSAAAVALGMCEAAIGTQTGGSLIRPASFCGVYALKPTYAALPRGGIHELARSLDHPGFLGRSVRDLACLFEAAGPHTIVLYQPLPPRIGRVRGIFEERCSPRMRQAVDRALDLWSAAGARIVEVDAAENSYAIHDFHYRIMAAEAARVHIDRVSDYPPRLEELIADGEQVTALDYLIAKEFQARQRNQLIPYFDRVDVLALPSAADEAPDTSTTGDPFFNSPWSYMGVPVLGMPIAGPPESLPLGVQLIGRPNADLDGSLFRFGIWCEWTLRGDPIRWTPEMNNVHPRYRGASPVGWVESSS